MLSWGGVAAEGRQVLRSRLLRSWLLSRRRPSLSRDTELARLTWPRRRSSAAMLQCGTGSKLPYVNGALFGQGREMGSAQPSERPSQGLCSDRGAKRSQNSPPKDLEKPFKGRCAVADPVSRYSGASGQKTRGAPAMRMLPLFGKRTPARDRKGARGSVRAMPEHSTCRDGLVVTDEHSHPA